MFYSCRFRNLHACNFYSKFTNRMDTDDHHWCLLTFITCFLKSFPLSRLSLTWCTVIHSTVVQNRIRQSVSCINPLDLGKESDLYFTSRWKSSVPNIWHIFELTQEHNPMNNKKKKLPKTFLSNVRNSKCVLWLQNRHLGKCPSYLKLQVNARIYVVKNNNLK